MICPSPKKEGGWSSKSRSTERSTLVLERKGTTHYGDEVKGHDFENEHC